MRCLNGRRTHARAVTVEPLEGFNGFRILNTGGDRVVDVVFESDKDRLAFVAFLMRPWQNNEAYPATPKPKIPDKWSE